MRTLKIALLATVATAALSSATLAADLIIDAPAVISSPAASYGLDGPYAGIYVLGQSHAGATDFGGGVVLGINFAQDGFLLGFEGDASVRTSHWESTWLEGQVIGKAGFLLSDSAALYALAGVGVNNHVLGGFYVPIGVGAEFAVTESLSLKAQYEFHWDPDDTPVHVGKIGLNIRF